MRKRGLAAGPGNGPESGAKAAESGDSLESRAKHADAAGERTAFGDAGGVKDWYAVETGTARLPLLDCGESGSTLRFLLPIALALRGDAVFAGHGRLLDRPLGPYREAFTEKGVRWERQGDRLAVRGQLMPGRYRLSGSVSSQFVTGLLFALPLLDGESEIVLTSPLESAVYVDMTLDVLARAGIVVENDGYQRFRVPGGQQYQAVNLPLEADWSQAAFWCAANFLENRVTLRGLRMESVQGDRAIVPLFRKMASPQPIPVEIDLSGIPDLLPPLAVMAAWRTSPTTFTRAARLRLKESDRLDSVETLLRTFQVSVKTGPDWMTVDGGIPDHCPPVTVDGCGDHRIVMAAAVLASVWEAPVTILGAEAVNKSYPAFFDHYRQLGGEIHVL
ncbi:MAG: 3-phosphoshikimate 1-carboxyvinyltransferase [Oscillibacter sp.]|nr:3-phosphoshikimate 1-carboxyvinyltransferase [Oscillibacter sp.]